MMPISRYVVRRAKLVLSLVLASGAMVALIGCGTTDPSIEGTSTSQTGTDSAPLLVTPAPTPDKEEIATEDVPPESPDASDPIEITHFVTLAESLTPQELVEFSDLIVTGTVVEIFPAQWTTHNGERPTDPWADGVVPDRYTIVTPVVLQLDDQLILSLSSSVIEGPSLTIVTEGGQVGEDMVSTNAPWHHYSVGEEILVALERSDTTLQTGSSVWQPIAKYALSDDGFVTTYDDRVQTEELIDELNSAAASP